MKYICKICGEPSPYERVNHCKKHHSEYSKGLYQKHKQVTLERLKEIEKEKGVQRC